MKINKLFNKLKISYNKFAFTTVPFSLFNYKIIRLMFLYGYLSNVLWIDDVFSKKRYIIIKFSIKIINSTFINLILSKLDFYTLNNDSKLFYIKKWIYKNNGLVIISSSNNSLFSNIISLDYAINNTISGIILFAIFN